MSNPKRTLGLLGVLALTISACSKRFGQQRSRERRGAERGRAERRRIGGPFGGRRRARDRRLVAHHHR